MTAAELVGELEGLGVSLWEEDGELHFRGPKGLMTPERREALRGHKDEVVAYLRGGALVTPDPHARFDPFPLTDVQSAYVVGRGDAFAYGGVGCHGYGEVALPPLEPRRIEEAWRTLVARHDMLRAVVGADGSQRVLAQPPPYRVHAADLRGADPERVAEAVERTRHEMDHRVYAPGDWPLFDVRLTRTDGGLLLHLSIDFLIADFVSIQLLLDELHQLVFEPERSLRPIDVTFRDCLLAERGARGGAAYERDREYWLARIDDLPPAPDLPLVDRPTDAPPRFHRLALQLEPADWRRLKTHAGAHHVTASCAVLAAYAEVFARWSRRPRFTLDVTLLNRSPLHPHVERLVGDFTSIELLAVEPVPGTFRERAQALQGRLWDDLDHRLYSGVDLIRELARRAGAERPLFPVVFTSAIGLAGDGDGGLLGLGELVYGISQTPQVWIDCQVAVRGGGLGLNWDVREGVFPDGVVDDMFAAFEDLLRRLAEDEAAWLAEDVVGLPPAQAARRAAVNATAAPLPDALLHEPVFAQALRTPDRAAVFAGETTLTYRELAARASAVAGELHRCDVHPGAAVGIVMEKGWEQVAAVLGTLRAGAVYVPVDATQPPARREQMLADARVACVLTQSWLEAEGERTAIAVDLLPPGEAGDEPPARLVQPDELAYVIYTSGSTGTPKGVMIAHRAALNTIDDVNRRFAIGADDRVLGLSSLGFDLSVYDIFGPLAVGGALVLPEAARRGDPSHWAELVAAHRVTVWNSVPAQMQMLVDYLRAVPPPDLSSLRLALLSGDWIPVTLPDEARARLPTALVSLGGATEASIWSIAFPIGDVDRAWRSIPYGKPLANQTFQVLDESFCDRPDYVPGELFIGGAGLAAGYFGDEAKTAERFVRHPRSGERLYRTGDVGRYLPDGNIEFLGREDFQVKIRGHRIELAEIEAALVAEPAVAAAAAVVDGDGPLDRRLLAAVEPAHVPSPPLPRERLERASAATSERVLAGVDLDRYLAYARLLDDLALVSMLDAFRENGLFAPGDAHTMGEILAGARVAPRHRRLARRWLRALVESGTVELAADRYAVAGLGNGRSDASWERVAAAAREAGERPEVVDYFRTSSRHAAAMLRGDDDPLRLLFPDGRLDVTASLYADALFNRWANAVAAAVVRALGPETAHGPLRVLEVGAGTGSTTRRVVEALAGVGVDYLFTDLSQFFLNQARELFADVPGMRFATYDLDADYRSQALAPNSFDVVVAGDVLHATRDVSRTLASVRDLLAPGGWLVFLEMTRDHYQIMTSLELLIRLDDEAGDFVDERRGRDQTFLARDEWLRALDGAGGEVALCVPAAGERIAELGMHVFAARFKGDRARVDAGGLNARLAERLPAYMLPQAIEVFDALPLTDNGKVDRKTLGARLSLRGRERPAAAARGEPASDLERRLADVWGEVLSVERVAPSDDFFELGGDSLLAAQLSGRLIEEVDEARGLFFDRVLQALLEGRTVAALAAYVSQGAADVEAGPAVPAPAAQPRSPVVALSGPVAEAVLVLVHDATGTVVRYRRLADALAERGAIAGLVVNDPAGYLELPANVLVQRSAADHARAIAAELRRPVRLVGHGAGGLLAVEVARALAEAGTPAEALALVAAAPPPWRLDDELLLEYLFARHIGARPERLDAPPERELADALGAQREPAVAVRDWLGVQAERTQLERLASYALAVPPAERDTAQDIGLRFRVFAHTLAAVAAHATSPYAGDLTLLLPAAETELWPSLREDASAFWLERCLGDVRVADVPGDYFSCIEHAAAATGEAA